MFDIIKRLFYYFFAVLINGSKTGENHAGNNRRFNFSGRFLCLFSSAIFILIWEPIMRVYIYAANDELLCDVPAHKQGQFIVAEHPTFNFEVQVATYCFNEGDMTAGTIEDKDDITVATWEIK